MRLDVWLLVFLESGCAERGALEGTWSCSGSARAIQLSTEVAQFDFEDPVEISASGVDWFCDDTVPLVGDPNQLLEAEQTLDGCTIEGVAWDLNELTFEIQPEGTVNGEYNIDDGSTKWLADYTCAQAS